MKYQKLLSVIPFYGGKGRMAHFIADRLDYMHSDVFVTPFGGGCRVLLNKPRHPIEIYNDFSSGLCALMRVLSQRDTAIELIQRVMDSEYSQEQFEEAKELFDRSGDVKEYTWKKIMDCLARKFPQMDRRSLPRLFDYGIAVEDLQKPNEELKRRWDILIEAKKKDSLFKSELDSLLKDWILISDAEKEMEPETLLEGEELKAPRKLAAIQQGKDIYGINDMELAFATYVVYTMSRDGMGKVFSESKFRSTEQYHKRAESLFACAERLEGIEVQQLDAFMFFRKEKEMDNGPGTEGRMIGDWLDNPSVMMYLDPSYISPTSEQEALEGIDWRGVNCLSDAIKEKYRGGREPANLGEIYARSFNYEEQENFLRLICNAKCKILISNYDLLLYDKYLTLNGWQRTEFLTSTSVGSRAGNDRTEVIWWNY